MAKEVRSATGVGTNLAIKYFYDRYLEIHGTQYSATSQHMAIGSGLLRNLVRKFGLVEIQVRIEAYLADAWHREHGGQSLIGFVKYHQSMATKAVAMRLRGWFSLSEEQREECERALDFFVSRHLERRRAPYLIPGDRRIVALREVGQLVGEIGVREVRRRMAAYLDDQWVGDHGGFRLSQFLKDHQNWAAKSAAYAKPATWEAWQARHGTGILPSSVKLYPGTSTPMFFGVDEIDDRG